jgi:hypothetical protein
LIKFELTLPFSCLDVLSCGVTFPDNLTAQRSAAQRSAAQRNATQHNTAQHFVSNWVSKYNNTTLARALFLNIKVMKPEANTKLVKYIIE